MKIVNLCYCALMLATLIGCGTGVSPHYIKFAGGGLVFNYRVAQASMIVVAQQVMPMPEGSTVEAIFDVPGTATRQSVKQPAMDGKLTYKLQSDPLTHIVKGVQYTVTLRVLDKMGKEIDRVEHVYVSDIDQATLPSKPSVDPITLKPLPPQP